MDRASYLCVAGLILVIASSANAYPREIIIDGPASINVDVDPITDEKIISVDTNPVRDPLADETVTVLKRDEPERAKASLVELHSPKLTLVVGANGTPAAEGLVPSVVLITASDKEISPAVPAVQSIASLRSAELDSILEEERSESVLAVDKIVQDSLKQATAGLDLGSLVKPSVSLGNKPLKLDLSGVLHLRNTEHETITNVDSIDPLKKHVREEPETSTAAPETTETPKAPTSEVKPQVPLPSEGNPPKEPTLVVPPGSPVEPILESTTVPPVETTTAGSSTGTSILNTTASPLEPTPTIAGEVEHLNTTELPPGKNVSLPGLKTPGTLPAFPDKIGGVGTLPATLPGVVGSDKLPEGLPIKPGLPKPKPGGARPTIPPDVLATMPPIPDVSGLLHGNRLPPQFYLPPNLPGGIRPPQQIPSVPGNLPNNVRPPGNVPNLPPQLPQNFPGNLRPPSVPQQFPPGLPERPNFVPETQQQLPAAPGLPTPNFIPPSPPQNLPPGLPARPNFQPPQGPQQFPEGFPEGPPLPPQDFPQGLPQGGNLQSKENIPQFSLGMERPPQQPGLQENRPLGQPMFQQPYELANGQRPQFQQQQEFPHYQPENRPQGFEGKEGNNQLLPQSQIPQEHLGVPPQEQGRPQQPGLMVPNQYQGQPMGAVPAVQPSFADYYAKPHWTPQHYIHETYSALDDMQNYRVLPVNRDELMQAFRPSTRGEYLWRIVERDVLPEYYRPSAETLQSRYNFQQYFNPSFRSPIYY